MDMPWTGHIKQYYQVAHLLNRHGQVVVPHVQQYYQEAPCSMQWRGSNMVTDT